MDLHSLGEFLGSLWTVWALLVFAGIAFWAWRPRNKRRFEKDAQIPLNDDDR